MYSSAQLANINAAIKTVVDKLNTGDPRYDFKAEMSGDRVRIVEVISAGGAVIKEVRPRGRRSSSGENVTEALRSHLAGGGEEHADSLVSRVQGVMRRVGCGNVELLNEMQAALARAGF